MSDKKATPVFVIDAAPAIRWPVTVNLPVDGGELAPFEFTGVFKRLSEAEYDVILDAKKTDGQQDDSGKSRADVLNENAELFPKLLVGWDEVRNAAGEKVEFSAETLRQQILGVNGTYLSIGLWMALSEIRSGARLGN